MRWIYLIQALWISGEIDVTKKPNYPQGRIFAELSTKVWWLFAEDPPLVPGKSVGYSQGLPTSGDKKVDIFF
ncbi:hypothetical protein H3U88_06840 [Bifidobacterium sp. W8120]|nr:hypothetical protein [Bifidobacterium sp. W8120]